MTATTGALSTDQVGVIRAGGHEANGRMARIAVVIRGNVVGRLALGDGTVMATETSTENRGVIHAHDRLERELRVAERAIAPRRDVGRRPRRGADPRAGRVAARAGARCALEYGLRVTVLAG